jgi:hypothetical protein
MIKITDFNTICGELKTVAGAKGYVLSATEENLVNKLKDRAGLQLACIIPMLSTSGDLSGFIDETTTMFWAIEKHVDGQTDKSELEQYQRTQDAIMKVRGHIISMAEDGCSDFNNLDLNSMIIEPVWVSKGSWNGWSLELTF